MSRCWAKWKAQTVADRLRMAFEMFEFGVEMMAANLRRRHPSATPDAIDQMLADWLARPHGADLR